MSRALLFRIAAWIAVAGTSACRDEQLPKTFASFLAVRDRAAALGCEQDPEYTGKDGYGCIVDCACKVMVRVNPSVVVVDADHCSRAKAAALISYLLLPTVEPSYQDAFRRLLAAPPEPFPFDNNQRVARVWGPNVVTVQRSAQVYWEARSCTYDSDNPCTQSDVVPAHDAERLHVSVRRRHRHDRDQLTLESWSAEPWQPRFCERWEKPWKLRLRSSPAEHSTGGQPPAREADSERYAPDGDDHKTLRARPPHPVGARETARTGGP